MKQKNNIVNKLNNKLTHLNNNIKNSVQNDIVLNIVRIILVIYTAFVVPLLKENQLELVRNQLFRFIIVAIIVYLSFIDIVSALLLAVAFLTTIHQANQNNSVSSTIQNLDSSVVSNTQETNNLGENSVVNKIENLIHHKDNFESNNDNDSDNLKIKVENNNSNNNKNNEANNSNNNVVNNSNNNKVNNANNNVDNEANNSINNMNNKANNVNNELLNTENLPVPHDSSLVSNLQVFDANNASQKKVKTDPNLTKNNNNLIDKLNQEQPASETLTDNILRSNNNNDPVGLTTGENLFAAQENAVPNANLLSDNEVRTFNEMHTTQGLGKPMGYKAKRYDGYHFKEGDHKNLVHDMLRNEIL